MLLLRTLALLAAFALLLTSCGERAEPLGELEPQYPVTVSGAEERAAVLDSSPRRIVALDGGSAEILIELGAADLLVGVPAAAGLAELRSAVRVVSSAGVLNVEAVSKVMPDLVIATTDTDTVELGRVERASEAAVYVQPARSLAEVRRAILELGFLLGRSVRARELVSEIDRRVAQVDRVLAGVGDRTVFVDIGLLITVPERSLLADLVRRAGGESVTKARGIGPYGAERLAQLDPDVYLAVSSSSEAAERLRSDPRTRSLRAVAEGDVAVLSEELVLRAGPRVGEALEAVARALHPDVFPAR